MAGWKSSLHVHQGDKRMQGFMNYEVAIECDETSYRELVLALAFTFGFIVE